MSSPSPLSESIFSPYLAPSLSSLLAHLPASTPLDTLSRTTPGRLKTTALPNLSTIELVSSEDFENDYNPLYAASFPKQTERERTDLIVERLAAQARGERKGLAPYRIVGVRDPNGEVIGAAQFSVLPVPPRRREGVSSSSSVVNDQTQPSKDGEDHDVEDHPLRQTPHFTFAVPYLQYIYVRRQNRRQDMSEVLHTMVLAVTAADAALMDLEDDTTTASAQNSKPLAQKPPRTVPFTLFETDPPDHGDDQVSRAYALERSKIHTSTGGVALILRRPKPPNQNSAPRGKATEAEHEDEGDILSAHVQPGLEPGEPPLTLTWMIRPSPNSAPPGKDYDLTRLGSALLAAFYQSFRDEGFPKKNICLAERIVEARMRGSTFAVMPLAEVKDFALEKEFLDLEEG